MPKYDIERDRRLPPEEETAVLDVLDGDKRMFFILALETAMRMRECYTLDVSQVSAEKRTIHLERSKNGDNRQVPLPPLAPDSMCREVWHAQELADSGKTSAVTPGCVRLRSTQGRLSASRKATIPRMNFIDGFPIASAVVHLCTSRLR
jgi:hypothetical protein